MSLRNRARNLQRITTLTYQQALDRLRALGARPAELSRRTGWPLDVCDGYLVCGRAPIPVVAAPALPAPEDPPELARVCGAIRDAIGAQRVRVIDLAGRLLAEVGAAAPNAQLRTLEIGGRARLVVDVADGLPALLVDFCVQQLHGDLKQALVACGLPAPRPSDRDEAARLSRRHRVPFVTLRKLEIAEAALALVPLGFARRHSLVPLARDSSTLIVAIADPSNRYAITVLKSRTGLEIEVVVADEGEIDETLDRLRGERWQGGDEE